MKKNITQKFQSLQGMKDILPEEKKWYEKVKYAANKMVEFYNFLEIETPIIEREELFQKTTGESSDVIQKELYAFTTKGGEKVVLRPEFTPALARVYIERGLVNRPKPLKLYTTGPLFRHEKPQKGRYRQFNQFDFEVFGSDHPIEDAKLIQLFVNILARLGFNDVIVKLNSIGCRDCRLAYENALKKYYKKYLPKICDDCKVRFQKNPLRLLDCKDPKCQPIKAVAPKTMDFLCPFCKEHFENLKEYLTAAGLPFKLDNYLVRGLDYYTQTVFEIFSEGVSGGALISGGRYNYLIEEIGGRPTPAVGGAGGIERIMEAMQEKKLSSTIEHTDWSKYTVYLAALTETARRKALTVLEILKKNDIRCIESLSKNNLKIQLKLAKKLPAQIVLILGEKEVFDNTIIIRNKRTTSQRTVEIKDLTAELYFDFAKEDAAGTVVADPSQTIESITREEKEGEGDRK